MTIERPTGIFRGFLLLLLTAVAASRPAHAQILYGSILGDIVDAAGAVVPGATVTILHKDTNQSRTATTTGDGQYTFPTIATGPYKVTVAAAAFRTATQDDVLVAVNSQVRVNIKLELGAVTESVTVSASGVTLQTDRSEVRDEIRGEILRDAPVPLGGNYQMLFVTLPGFSPPEEAHSIPSNPSRALQFSVNGTSRSLNNTRIDGASSTNLWLPHMTAYVPSREAIETVNVVTNSFDAEQGLAGGAAINVQIKSGTNRRHGSLFANHNNQHLKTYSWISDKRQAQPKFIYNQFGGSVGGPIKRDKLFYFVAYEGTREAQAASRFVTVPTAAMKGGDLTASPTLIYDPLTGTDNDGRGRTPFDDNIIPQHRIDPAVQRILGMGLWPNSNQRGAGALQLTRNYLAVGPTTLFRDTVDSKVSWNVNDRLSAFVRFSVLDFRTDNPQIFGGMGGAALHPTSNNPGNGFGNTFSGTLSATYVVSPSLLLDAYFGYTLMDTNVEQPRLDEKVGLDLLKIPGTNGPRRFEGGWPRFRIDGFDDFGLPVDFMPYYRNDPQWQYAANANWTRRKHNVRFGLDFYIQHLNHNQPEISGDGEFPAAGGFRFRQGTTQLRGGPGGNDYNSFAAFLLGFSRNTGKIHQYPDDGYTTRAKLFSVYARDQWQVTRRLTFTYGSRWEYFPFPRRADRGLERYDFDNNKIWACGVGVVPVNCGINVGAGQFAPRGGVAWRVTDTFVVRAGYGITTDPFNWSRPLRTNYPILTNQAIEAASTFYWATTLRDGIPAVPAPALGNGILDLPLTATVITIDNNNTVRGYIQSWNLTLEKDFRGWIGSAGYVATRSINQMAALDMNWSPIGGGSTGRQMVVKYGRAAATELLASVGTPKYDSLQLRAIRRFTGGYQIRIGYTWGHGIGYTSEASGEGTRVDIPSEYHRNYGRLNQDIRHNLQVTSTLELPFGKRKRWANAGTAAKILGGWQVNTVFSAYTGRPLTIAGSGTSLNSPSAGQFADCLAPAKKLGRVDQWYDINTFASVPTTEVRFGTCGINSVSAPGLINLDTGVFRRFQFGESVRLQFRGEMFNVSNTPHFGAPNGTQNNANFMIITTLRNIGREGRSERLYRLGLRLSW